MFSRTKARAVRSPCAAAATAVSNSSLVFVIVSENPGVTVAPPERVCSRSQRKPSKSNHPDRLVSAYLPSSRDIDTAPSGMFSGDFGGVVTTKVGVIHHASQSDRRSPGHLGEVLSPLTPSINRDDAQARGSRPYCRHRANTSAAIFTAALASVPVSAALRSRPDFTRCRTDSDSADNSTARSACLRARAKSPPRQRQFCGDPFDPNFLPPQPALGIQTRPTLRQQAPAEREPATAEGVCGQTGQSVTGSLWITWQAADDRQCAPVPRGRECMASALAKKRRPRVADREARTRSECVENPAVSRSRTSNAGPRSCVVALTTSTTAVVHQSRVEQGAGRRSRSGSAPNAADSRGPGSAVVSLGTGD